MADSGHLWGASDVQRPDNPEFIWIKDTQKKTLMIEHYNLMDYMERCIVVIKDWQNGKYGHGRQTDVSC
jgi:hypothetical protein